jgi:UDP-N-acetylmuramoyl-L-alanyl-D-glutamate--2,6-diaminopimelate ligase
MSLQKDHPMKLSDLLSALPFGFPPPDDDPDITAPVTADPQQIQPGGVFVAHQGQDGDGHTHLEQAIQQGAAAIIGEDPTLKLPLPYVYLHSGKEALGYLASAYHGYPSRSLIIVGITGTNGKTTTTHITHHILKTAGVRAGMMTSREESAEAIQQQLHQMVETGLTHCLLEVDSWGLDQGRFNGIEFDVAVLTNLTPEHLDWHGSFEAYRDAKAKLFRMVANRHPKGDQPSIAVINADDPSAPETFAQAAIGSHYLMLYSLNQTNADFYADRIHYRPNGTSFMLRGNAGDLPIQSPLVGSFNIMNVLAGTVAAISAMPQPIHQQRMINAIPLAISTLPPIPGGTGDHQREK